MPAALTAHEYNEQIEEKKQRDRDKYRMVEGRFACTTCGNFIRRKLIPHPIWEDGHPPAPGPGQCYYEAVPYCPECEDEPNYIGAPITHSNNHSRVNVIPSIESRVESD